MCGLLLADEMTGNERKFSRFEFCRAHKTTTFSISSDILTVLFDSCVCRVGVCSLIEFIQHLGLNSEVT